MDAAKQRRLKELDAKGSIAWTAREAEEHHSLWMERYRETGKVSESRRVEIFESDDPLVNLLRSTIETNETDSTITKWQRRMIDNYRALGLTECEAQVAAGVHDAKLRELATNPKAQTQFLQSLKEAK